MPLERVDKLLCDQGLVSSRMQAQKLIAASAVRAKVDGIWCVVNKTSLKLPQHTEFEIQSIDELRYVSRAGLKLEAALHWLEKQPDFNPQEIKRVLDIGQSTGGFTDCILQWGAELVVGVDVGHSQLAASLKENPKVVCLEGVNARALPQSLRTHYAPEGFDMVIMDVSFISQTKIIATVAPFLKKAGYFISLIKPQFEVGKDHLGKNGIVTDEGLRQLANTTVSKCVEGANLSVKKILASPLHGADGNQESLLIAQNKLTNS